MSVELFDEDEDREYRRRRCSACGDRMWSSSQLVHDLTCPAVHPATAQMPRVVTQAPTPVRRTRQPRSGPAASGWSLADDDIVALERRFSRDALDAWLARHLEANRRPLSEVRAERARCAAVERTLRATADALTLALEAAGAGDVTSLTCLCQTVEALAASTLNALEG